MPRAAHTSSSLPTIALFLVLVTITTAATACTASKLSQDADVTLTGSVLDMGGKPLAGAKVVLVKEVDFGEAVLGITFFAATLGTICLADPAPAICSKAKRATTTDEGTYRFQLKGRDTQGTVGTAATFHLSTAVAAGPSVSARFQIQRTALEVPSLRIWAPDLQVTQGRTVRATWPARDPSATERLAFYDGDNAASNIIWSSEGRSPINLDPRLLEDVRGTAAVESESNEEADGTRFQLTYQSARVNYTGTNTPPSRNAPCPPTPDPCPLTDGVLSPPPTAPPTRQEVIVDLSRSSTPTLIVVRRCPGSCDVETSVDGLTYKVVGSGQEPFFTVTPVLGTPVRYIKVKSVTDLGGLAEVSAWLA